MQTTDPAQPISVETTSSIDPHAIRTEEPSRMNKSTGDLISDRALLMPLIPLECRRILEFGCATGELARALKARQNCHITGVVMTPETARVSSSNYDALVPGGLEPESLRFPEKSFDAFICADALENLVNPWLSLQSAWPMKIRALARSAPS
jgi:SAM-dependent methyltransferase